MEKTGNLEKLTYDFNIAANLEIFMVNLDGWYRVTGQKCVVDKNKTYADGGEVESMNFFVVKNENDKYYNWVGYNVDETITDKQVNEFEKLYF